MPGIHQPPSCSTGHGRPTSWPCCVPLTILGVPLAMIVVVGSSRGFYVDGDAIAADSRATDNTGGFTAVRQSDINLGQPAILVGLSGQELLTEVRVIVFGVPATSGQLRFDEFDYRLDVWKRDDYFANGEAEFHIDLGEPVGIELVPNGATRIVPHVAFGTAGVGGGNATTYDFRFDLTHLPSGGPWQNLFASPLAPGDWVFGFQSWHVPATSGTLRVSGSNAAEGPLPLFNRDNGTPRGVLGGQDPNNITLRWGMSLAAVPEVTPCNLAGDFNANAAVDAADYTVWRDNFDAPSESCLCHAGDGLNGVDAGDYILWRQNFGVRSAAPQSASGPVPEPASLLMLVGSSLILNRQRPRYKSAVFPHSYDCVSRA